MGKDDAKNHALRSTELRPGTGAVFSSYESPPGEHPKPLETKLSDGTILVEEFPTGISEEQLRRIAHMAFRAVFADKPEYFKKTPDGEPAE